MKIGDFVTVNFVDKYPLHNRVGKLLHQDNISIGLEFADGTKELFMLDVITSITAVEENEKADEIIILEEVLDEYRAITNALGVPCKLDGTRIGDTVTRLKSGEYKIVHNKEW